VSAAPPIPDVFGWTFAWLPYVCSDCACTRVVAMGQLPDKITKRVNLGKFHRTIGAVLGWYLLKHKTDPTWVCADCFGSRVLDAVLQARAGHWGLRRLVDEAADWRVDVMAIKEAA
jgi:hypothetical protein